MKVAIYCGTSFGKNPIYKKKSIELINYLKKKDSKLCMVVVKLVLWV